MQVLLSSACGRDHCAADAARRRAALRWPPPPLPRMPPPRPEPPIVPVPTIALELVPPAPLMARAEAILPACAGCRMVKSVAGRVGGGCPSVRGSDARISGRWTGPSSRVRSSSSPPSASSASAASTVSTGPATMPSSAVSSVPVISMSCGNAFAGPSEESSAGSSGSCSFGAAREPLRGKRRGRLRLAAKPRHLRLLEFVLGFAGRAARLLHFVADHRDDGVVGDAAFARAIVVQNVTKPKLALLHRKTPDGTSLGRERNCERRRNTSRACLLLARR